MFKPNIGQQEVSSLLRVAQSGSFILGPEVKTFEQEVCDYLKVDHAIGVASGTDALVLALEALYVSRNDEVIVPAWSFFATAEAVSRVGATPIFVDIDETYNINPELIETNSKTRAIIAVHNYGYPANVDALRGNIPIICDAAQAFGVRAPNALVSCHSFFPSKVLGGFGDGGMVTTNTYPLAQEIKKLRVHGRSNGTFVRVGYNSRLDALQAAILRVKLNHIEQSLSRRRDIADYYNRHLKVELPPSHSGHAWGVYTIQSDWRDEIKAALKENDIESAIHYPSALPDLPVYKKEGYWPVARRAAQRVLSLPIYPGLREQDRIIEVVNRYARN